MLQHGACLRKGYAGEQFGKLTDRNSVFKTQAPLKRSGSRSTAEQLDQSIMFKIVAPAHVDPA
jgi:hypothetical protein